MKNQFFDQKIFSNIETPIQKIIELNVKTVQGMSYIKPGELLSLKKPEELLEKNMDIFIQNSHMALNYMRDSFNILENHWFSMSHKVEENLKNTVKEASSSVTKATKKTVSAAKTSAKKVVAKSKAPMKKAKPVVQSKNTVSSPVKHAVKASDKAKPGLQIKKPLSQEASKLNNSTEKTGPKDLGLNFNKTHHIPN